MIAVMLTFRTMIALICALTLRSTMLFAQAGPIIRLGAPEYTVTLSSSLRAQVLVSKSGALLVLDAELQNLQYFASPESVPSAVGRLGAGPGEYKGPSKILLLSGDTLGVWDEALHRLLVIGPKGAPLRTLTAPTWLPAPADPLGGDVAGSVLFRVADSFLGSQ